MSVRIQLRRDTAANWSTNNPILLSGEIGIETDTLKIKIGTGTYWNSITSYANVVPSDLTELAQDAVNTALTVGAGVLKTYNDASNTITLEVDNSVVATLTGSQTLINKSLTTPTIGSFTNSNHSHLNSAGGGTITASAISDFTEASQDAVNSALVAGSGISKTYDDLGNTITFDNTGVLSITGTENKITADHSNGNVTLTLPSALNLGSAHLSSNLTVDGNLTVSGTTTTFSTTNLDISDPIIYIGTSNTGNSIDLGVIGHFDNGTYQHTGLVRDATDGRWKLFEGIEAEPTTTVNFSTWTGATLELGTILADSITVGNVTNTEFGYLDGVTSSIQTQINSKAASSDIAELAQDAIGGIVGSGILYSDSTPSLTLDSTVVQLRVSGITDTEIGYLDGVTSAIQTQIDAKSPIASPTFTGTVSGITKSMVGLGNVDNVSDVDKPISSYTQSALDLKAPLYNPTFTGTVILPSGTSIASVSGTEISYLDGVTSAIQTQLNDKASSSSLSSHESNTGTHGVGVIVGTSETQTLTNKSISGSTNTLSSIANSSLTNSKVTIGSTDISLGSTATTIAGLSSVTSTSFVGALTGNADTVTNGVYTTNLASGVLTFLGTPTSANLAAALTDETGSTSAPKVVFSNTPAITSPLISTKLSLYTNAYIEFEGSTLDANKTTLTVVDPTAARTITLPNATGTVVLKDSTDTLTNKTFDTAATGNSLSINGTSVSAVTGSGSVVLAASPTITGTLTASDITISGNLTVSGTTTTVNATNLEISDPLIYLATGNSANLSDIGFVGHATVSSTYQHMGLVRDHTDGKWKLFSGVTTEPGSSTINLTGATYDTLKAGTFEGNLSGNVTGNVTGALTGNADTATKLATARAINGTSFDGSAAITITANTTNNLTIGTGLSGSSFNGSSAVTIAIDSTVATLTGTQTLTNKTITSPSIQTPTITGAITLSASGVTFTDGTQTKEGVPSRTPIIAKTASYTLSALTERDSLIEVSSASGTTITIPTNTAVAYPIGTSIDILQTSTGQVTIAGDTGVTVNGTPGLKLRAQWSSCTLFKRATDSWIVLGDLSA